MKQKIPFRKIQCIHFVGIGGIGMCGIADVLLQQGYQITGSDLAENASVARLRAQGATVYIGHDAAHVQETNVVVVSTAIAPNNPEVLAAKAANIPVIPRAEMLAELMRGQTGIAIAGTHGKTTTTSLVTSILLQAQLDPSYVIGGLLTGAGNTASSGSSHYFVAEADESDASFLHLKPTIAVVTNIDADHMQTYNDNFNQLRDTFATFLHHLPFYGLCVLCEDDDEVRTLRQHIARPVVTYGFSTTADFRITDWAQNTTHSSFTVLRPQGEPLQITLNLPGQHNALNATAAIAVASELGVNDADICYALLNFQGIGRRFQVIGECDFNRSRALLIDDYAHHPNEIQATIAAMRHAWPDRRLLMVFQPHRYSRTEALFDDFARALSLVDQLVLMDIYPAGEVPIPGIDSNALIRAVRQRTEHNPVHVKDFDELTQLLPSLVETNDVLMTLGAGSIGRYPAQLMQHFGVATV